MQCACAILSSVSCPDLYYFSTLSHKRYNFRKKNTEYKICVLIFSATFVWNISHFKKKWAKYDNKFYISLTVHHVMILGKLPTCCTNFFYVFISIYNSLHISSTSCSSSGETNFINTASGNSHSMLVAEMFAGWKKPSSNLHRSLPPT